MVEEEAERVRTIFRRYLVKAGKVDVIVVYKVDRLTRSLADFAKLVELFDARQYAMLRFVALILAVWIWCNSDRRQERVWRAQRLGAKIHAIATFVGGRDRTSRI